MVSSRIMYSPKKTVMKKKHHNRYLIYITTLAVMLIINGCDEPTLEPITETGTMLDVEGNEYNTVKIGNQWWMAENLRVTSFRSGIAIGRIDDNEQWKNTLAPAYTIYNNTAAPGLLYNFFAVDNSEQIAPEGWHIPTDEDWKELEEYLGMVVSELDKTNWRGTDQGDLLKEITTSSSGWVLHEGVWGTNETGFNAIGGSCRVFNGEWGIPGIRHAGYWWSSTTNKGYGWYRYLDYKKSGIFRYSAHPNYGFSIRCIKD